MVARVCQEVFNLFLLKILNNELLNDKTLFPSLLVPSGNITKFFLFFKWFKIKFSCFFKDETFIDLLAVQIN